MFSKFKKTKSKTEIPRWASFFKEDEYNEFLKAIEDYFYSKNITYNLGDGIITAGPNDFGMEVLGLVNVAQVCKQDEKSNYAEIVKGHFDSFERHNRFDAAFNNIVHDFEKVKEYIAVRLYPDDYVPEQAKEASIIKNFAGDIILMLVFDLPDSIKSITAELAKNWNKTVDELFETGIQNIKNKYPIDISRQQFVDFNIWFVQGDHFFVPNIVFDFGTLQKLAGSNGLLIGLPHRHAAIIYPIENIEVINALNALIPTVYGMFQEGPGSISNNVFWYKDGHYENLPYKLADNKIQFYPPEGFVNMLNSLEQDDEES
jgi:hypothetical protein